MGGVVMVLCQPGLGYTAFFINLLLNFKKVSIHNMHAWSGVHSDLSLLSMGLA